MNLARTKAAVEAHSEALRAFHAGLDSASDDEAWRLLWAVERAERAVGEAFAADTADRNSPDVAKLVRPRDPWLLRLIEKYT